MSLPLNHLTLAVHDIDEAFAFYRDQLRLTAVMKSSWSAYFDAGGFWLALTEGKGEMSGKTHFAFSVSAREFTAVVERLVAFGVRVWRENETEGNSFYFCDPSGNQLEIHVGDLASRVMHGKANWGDDVMWFV